MSVLNKWRVYCTTESRYNHIWLENGVSAPSNCPVNTAHAINNSLTRIVDTSSPTSVTISQEIVSTGGNYAYATEAFTALANQTTMYEFSFPINISIMDTSFVATNENVGDSWSWIISPDTLIGVLTSSIEVGDTELDVSSGVFTFVKVGFYVTIDDGITSEELGRVLAVDSDGGTITVEKAASNSFAVGSNIKMSIYFTKDGELGHPWLYQYGVSKIRSSHVPANTLLRVLYTNKSPTVDKRIVVSMEYLY
jgi:hypothetical protein